MELKRGKLKNYVIFVGKYFKDDAETLYNLLFQKIGTPGHGSNNLKLEGVTNGIKGPFSFIFT